MIYRCNLHYSLLVEWLFRYNAYFIISLFSLGSHHERYNEVAVYLYNEYVKDFWHELLLFVIISDGDDDDIWLAVTHFKSSFLPMCSVYSVLPFQVHVRRNTHSWWVLVGLWNQRNGPIFIPYSRCLISCLKVIISVHSLLFSVCSHKSQNEY